MRGAEYISSILVDRVPRPMPSLSDPSAVRPDLLLFPTELERVGFERSGALPRGGVLTETCGFGPIAAAARTAQLLNRIPARRIILVGIAGTYDEQRFPVGSAVAFDAVVVDGIGAGEGDTFRGPAALGFAQWPGSPDTCEAAVYERLRLEPLTRADSADDGRLLVTVCAASGSAAEAKTRHTAHPNATAEDMEGFAVALAGELHRVPVTVVRGISNVAGDRDRNHWRIEAALSSVHRLVFDALDGLALDGLAVDGQQSAEEGAGR